MVPINEYALNRDFWMRVNWPKFGKGPSITGLFFQHFFKTQTEKNSEKFKTHPIFRKNSTFIDSKTQIPGNCLKNILSLKIVHTDLGVTIGA